MARARALLIALSAAVIGSIAGFSWGMSSARTFTDSYKDREFGGLFYETNQRLLQVQKENENLREQIKILEQMVATQQAQLDEINAVMRNVAE